MAATPPPTITPVPTPAPQRGDRATFATRFDSFITWVITAVTQFGNVATNVYNNAVDAFTSAGSAASSASTAKVAADSAVLVAEATAWVSGTTYAKGVCVWSPIDAQTYRRLIAGTGTVDPSSDSTNWVRISLGPLPYLHVREEQPSGTSGGTSTGNTTHVRTLNTIVGINSIPGAALASNMVTLPAGTYEFDAQAPCRASGALGRLSLYNHTDSVALVVGPNGMADAAGASSACSGRFTLAAAKDIKLNHFIAAGQATTGLGVAHTTGAVEIYSSLIIRKVA